MAAVRAIGLLYSGDNIELRGSENSERLVNELYKEADSVKAFLDDSLERKKGSRIKRSDIFEQYRKYCEENERIVYKKNIFFTNLREKGIEERKVGGIFYFMDIDLISDFEPVDGEGQQRLPF